MFRLLWAWLALGVLLYPAAGAKAADVYILGDSIGEGVAMAAHVRGLARVSVHIRGRGPIDQIERTPKGATAILVLGSNDADGITSNLDKPIDNIVQAAAKRDIRLVWIGPHCVRRSWDHKARELDQYLSTALEARKVQYVSMRDPALCSGHLWERDGVHLKMLGYAFIWEKARVAAGLPETTVPKSASSAGRKLATDETDSEKTGRAKKQAENAARARSEAERRRRERGFFDLF
jgi:hypothetical protein